jgi:hypothetical protein
MYSRETSMKNYNTTMIFWKFGRVYPSIICNFHSCSSQIHSCFYIFYSCFTKTGMIHNETTIIFPKTSINHTETTILISKTGVKYRYKESFHDIQLTTSTKVC